MSEPFTLLHNPRCSTSRKALELLESRDIQPRIVEYLKDPLDETEIRDLLKKLSAGPRDLVRKKEPLFKELGLEAANDNALIRAMAAHPVLIERPVLIRGKRAAIGRPLSQIEELL